MAPRFLSAFLVLVASVGLASPSVFPETAAVIRVGTGPAVSVSFGGELLVPLPFVDASAGLEAVIDTSGGVAIRLEGSTLLFPAIGTVVPLAVGVGADVGLDDGRFGVHVGPMIGSDLLFVARIPATVSIYLAPGFETGQGFDLAWGAQARYYLDGFALELSSSDLQLIAFGVRFLF